MKDKRGQTKVVSKNLSPFWNEEVVIHVSEKEIARHQLCVQVSKSPASHTPKLRSL